MPARCVNDRAPDLLAPFLSQLKPKNAVMVSRFTLHICAMLAYSLPDSPIRSEEAHSWSKAYVNTNSESCLVEVARRECNKEGSHDGSASAERVNITSTSTPYLGTDLPCVDHYQQTKDRFGAYLDNLGCVCKVLLSLNIETCCVLPSHSSVRSASSRSLIPATTTTAIARPDDSSPMQPTGRCANDDGCCDTDSSGLAVAKHGHSILSPIESIGHYCTSKPSNNILSENIQWHGRIDKKGSSFSISSIGKSLKPDTKVVENSSPAMSCTNNEYCNDEGSDESLDVLPRSTDHKYCSVSGCCSTSTSDATIQHGAAKLTHQHVHKHGHHEHSHSQNHGKKQGLLSKRLFKTKRSCVDGGNCGGAISINKSGVQHSHAHVDDISPVYNSNSDVEYGLHEVEHLLIRVQGMDCTGCEKKLFKSLAGLPELSNIKTSLLLAQAEFDMAPSTSINSGTILNVIHRMTGYTCSRISNAGAELELVVHGRNIQEFLNLEWPHGVKDIVILNKTTIQVSYQPRDVGARQLLSDPFFQDTKLAPTSTSSLTATGRAQLLSTAYMTVLSAILTVPVLILTWAPLPPNPVLYGSVSLALATVVQVVIGWEFYKRTFNALIFSHMIDMDLLIVLSSTTAYVYSVISFGYLAAGKPLATGQFFETSTLLVSLIMVGRTVSALARQKAIESITIESLQNPKAILVDKETGREAEIDSRELEYGDVFKVLPDTSIVTDGVIESGESEVDESMITGESTLIVKTPGMPVVAGSVNHSGSLIVKVIRLPCENTIKSIGDLVDEAKTSKPKVQELADRVAGYFVPVILVITLLVFLVWIAVGKRVRHESSGVAAINAMTFAISVLIVSCPCAIGLAVPMVVVIAGGVAARHGLIFKTAETIDIARKVSHVIFDKTGTLTQVR
jgi:hypothetical protein